MKTYVLVHGAYHGGWCWKHVAGRLRALGHVVYTPTLTGLGERSHLLHCRPSLETFIEDVAQLIRFEELEEVILVGHSFGGSAVSGVADRMPERLRHLVYLDAQVLQNGQSSASLNPPRIEAYRQRALQGDGLGVPPPDDLTSYGITDPQMLQWVRPLLTPHPLQAYYDAIRLKHPVGNGVPATYIACAKPLFEGTAKAREFARSRADWTYLEMPTAHNAMMLMPEELTALLAAVA